MMNRRLMLLGSGALWAVPQSGATVLYDDRAIAVTASRVEKGDLWIASTELPEINEFTVKPQGACREDICIPLGKELKRNDWLNLSGFARKLKQAVVNEGSIWSFGEMPVLRSGFLQSRVAPDFAIQDRKGKTVRLTDFGEEKFYC